MAQLLVRNLDERVKVRLQRRARRNGRSMEEEVRDILRDAVHREEVPGKGLGSEIAGLFREAGLHEDIRELRGHLLKPPALDR